MQSHKLKTAPLTDEEIDGRTTTALFENIHSMEMFETNYKAIFAAANIRQAINLKLLEAPVTTHIRATRATPDRRAGGVWRGTRGRHRCSAREPGIAS